MRTLFDFAVLIFIYEVLRWIAIQVWKSSQH